MAYREKPNSPFLFDSETDRIVGIKNSDGSETILTSSVILAAALADIIASAITDGDTTHAPSGNAVFDALALKANLTNPAFVSVGLPEKTPVNAVASTGVLTSGGTNPKDDVAATAILTATGDGPVDGDTVTIGTVTYTFKTALTDPAVPNEILVAAPLPNLVLAINGGAGAGTNYSTGTVAHPDVTAGEVANGAFTVTAKVAGAAGNLIAKAKDGDDMDWDGTGDFLTGGSDAETVTIDTKVYTFRTALTPTEGEVLIGVNTEASLTNLKNAINHEGTPDTDYKCAAVHPTVTCTASDATTVTVAAKVKGVSGDAIATSETMPDAAWGETHLERGVNGTVGVANEICADANYIYHCVGANTIAGTNWRRIARGSAY